MPDWPRNSELRNSERSNKSSSPETDFSRSLYKKSDLRTTQHFDNENDGQTYVHKSRGENLSRTKTSKGGDDFDAHYIIPQYDADQIEKVQNESQQLFGKIWEDVMPDDIYAKIKSLTKQAKRTLSKAERSKIEINQYRIGIAASQKIDPALHKTVFRRLDLITQRLAQE